MISKTNALHYDLQKSSALEDDLQKPMHYMMIWSTPLICSCKEGIRRSWSPPTASIWSMYIETCLDLYILLSSPRAKRAGPKGLHAESARAVTGRRNSHRWEGGRLFEPSAGFFYGNSCNSGTESRKIVSKVGN